MDGVLRVRDGGPFIAWLRLVWVQLVSHAKSTLCLASRRRWAARDAKWAQQASPRPAGLGLPWISHRLLVDAPDLLMKSVLVVWIQHQWSTWLYLFSAVCCTDMSLNAWMFLLKSVWDSVLSLASAWLTSFAICLCILYDTTLDWIAFAHMSTLTNVEPKMSWVKDDRPGLGRPTWDSSHFGEISYISFLHSNTHQNLWNSLVLVVLAGLWS